MRLVKTYRAVPHDSDWGVWGAAKSIKVRLTKSGVIRASGIMSNSGHYAVELTRGEAQRIGEHAGLISHRTARTIYSVANDKPEGYVHLEKQPPADYERIAPKPRPSRMPIVIGLAVGFLTGLLIGVAL